MAERGLCRSRKTGIKAYSPGHIHPIPHSVTLQSRTVIHFAATSLLLICYVIFPVKLPLLLPSHLHGIPLLPFHSHSHSLTTNQPPPLLLRSSKATNHYPHSAATINHHHHHKESKGREYLSGGACSCNNSKVRRSVSRAEGEERREKRREKSFSPLFFLFP